MIDKEELGKLINKEFLDKLTSIDDLLYKNILLLDRLNENITKLREILAGKEKILLTVEPVSSLFYLPKYDNWEWKPIKLFNKTLKAGDRKIVWDLERSGWGWYALLVSSSPDIKFAIDIHGDSVIEVEYSIRELQQLGAQASVTGFRIVRYHDPTTDDPIPVYSVEWGVGAYNALGIPFRGKNVFALENPTSSDITYTFYAWLLLLKED